MTDYIPMTREGYNRKRAEIARLEEEEMPIILEKIAAARGEGDLSENAEYHAQREAQGLLQARINKLRSDLARATIVDPSKLPTDRVAFGATVVVRDLDLDDQEEFTLVGAGDEDYDAGKYLITSPIGQGLLGKQVGDKVEIPVPRGVLKYEILDIRFVER
ncbi:MAG: transcription elongation factor GreA [Pirellulaceae bacterium]|jgi:transcription elongation factor GreA|nr:transcription elongation factor GreA [Pirellulaceae bacterium]